MTGLVALSAILTAATPIYAAVAPTGGGGSANVLSFGLLALAILSFLIGLAGLGTALRLRPTGFPAMSRPRIRWRITLYWATVLVNLVVVPLIGLAGFGLFTEVPPDDLLRTGLLTLMLIGLIAANYVGVAVQRTLTRLKLQPTNVTERRQHRRSRWQHVKRSIRENLISAVSVLGISILIWYLIDKQLSDDYPYAVPIKVELVSEARDDWTVVDLDPEVLQVIFRGPKELVQEIRMEEIEGLIRLRADDLSGVPSRRTLEKDLSQIEFQTRSDRRWPAGITVLPAEPRDQHVRITVAPNVGQELVIQPGWLHEAIEGPMRGDLRVTVANFEPSRLYVVYPEQGGRTIERLYFEPLDVQALSSTPPRSGGQSIRLAVRPPEWLNRDTLQVFRSSERRVPVEWIRVDLVFHDQAEVVKTFRDVPVRFALPSGCTAAGVTVAASTASRWDQVRLQGPRQVLDRVTEGDIVLVWWPDETTIDLTMLTTSGSDQASGRLIPMRQDATLLPGVRLVAPRDTLAVLLVMPE